MASTVKTVKTETIIEVVSDVVDVTGTDAFEALEQFKAAKAAIKALEEQKDEAEARLRELLGDAEIAEMNGQVLYKLAHSTNSKIDRKLLGDLYPEALAQTTVKTPYTFIKAV
jgi:hypothetical protein